MNDEIENAQLFEYVSGILSDGLSAEAADLVLRRIEEHMGAIRTLRSVPLTNADEPQATFAPYDPGEPR